MFWLKVRKEYVLENFEELLDYLKNFNYDIENFQERSDFISTIECMENLCYEYDQRLSTLPSYHKLPEDIDENKLTRLIGATLLAQYYSKRDMTGVISALLSFTPFIAKSLSPDTIEKFQNIALSILKGFTVKNLKFSWINLETANFQKLSLISNLSYTEFYDDTDKTNCFEKKGTAIINKTEGLKIYPDLNIDQLRVTSVKSQVNIDNKDCKIGVYVSSKDYDSKKDFQSVYKSFNHIIDAQNQVRPTPPKKLKFYNIGDEVKIVVVNIVKSNPYHVKVWAETDSPEYEKITGLVDLRTDAYNRPEWQTVLGQMQVGDTLLAIYNQNSYGENHFDITKQFENSYRIIASDCAGLETLAIKIREYAKRGYQLITQSGIRVGLEYQQINTLDGDSSEIFYQLESGKPIRIKFYDYSPDTTADKFFTYCKLADDPIPSTSAKFTPANANDEISNSCIAEMCGIAGERSSSNENEMKSDQLLSSPLLALARLLWREIEAVDVEPVKRLTTLSIVAILCRLVGQEDDVTAIMLMRRYLSRLVSFAANQEVTPLNLTESERNSLPQSADYEKVIDALCNYKSPETELAVSPVLQSTSAITIAERLVPLINASNQIVNIVGAVELNNIKRVIVRAIDVEDEFIPILSNRTHYGMENEALEFKKSLVFPPVNRRRNASVDFDPDYQKWAILKTICGFLNSRVGGELIIGVNDGGYADGVKPDIDAMFASKMIDEPTLDRYRTFIQNLIDYSFIDSTSRDVISSDITALNVTYTPETNAEGVDLLHIYVKPYPYGIVKFKPELKRPDDIQESYVRRSGSTIPLTTSLSCEVMEYKTKINNDTTDKLVLTRTAISEKKAIILKNYASKSGVQDRKIEPYKIWQGQGLVYGYDLKKNTGRIFKLSRCSQVELTAQKWAHYRGTIDVEIDPFGFTIDKNNAIEVNILLTSYAAQLMREEYPDVELSENKSADYPFKLNCKTSSLDGITRFCLGLSNLVKIVDSPELVENIRQKAQQILEELN